MAVLVKVSEGKIVVTELIVEFERGGGTGEGSSSDGGGTGGCRSYGGCNHEIKKISCGGVNRRLVTCWALWVVYNYGGQMARGAGLASPPSFCAI